MASAGSRRTSGKFLLLSGRWWFITHGSFTFQELEILLGNEHISFTTSKIGSLVDVNSSKYAKFPIVIIFRSLFRTWLGSNMAKIAAGLGHLEGSRNCFRNEWGQNSFGDSPFWIRYCIWEVWRICTYLWAPDRERGILSKHQEDRVWLASLV